MRLRGRSDQAASDGTGSTGSWAGHGRGSPGYRRILIALGAAGVATFSQLYSPQGILPLIGRGLHVDAATSAITVSAGTFGLAVSVLAWSWLADRLGRAPAMKIALAASALLGLMAPLAPNFGVLLMLRIAEGVALGGVPALAVAYLHEEVHRAQAAVAAGIYISGTTVGGLLGRIVAAPFGDLGGWRLGMGAVAIMAAVAAVVFVVVAPAARGFRGPRQAAGMLRGIVVNLANPQLLILYGAAFGLMGGFVAIYNYLGYRLEQPPFNLPVSLAALLFFAYLAGTVSSPIAGRIAAQYGRRPVMLGAIAVMIAGVALTLPAWLPVILTGLVLMTAGFFGAHAIASGWVGARATEGTAQATSLYNLFYYAGSSLFGWLGGFAFVHGWFAIAGLVMSLAALVAIMAITALRPDT